MRAAHKTRAIASIWLVITGIVLIGLLGLSVDVGHVYLASHQLKNAADAAALAACLRVRSDQAAARQAAVDIALANTVAGQPVELDLNSGNNPDGDVVIGTYNRTTRVFTATTETPRAVKVTARRTDGSAGGRVPLFFGAIFGVEGAEISRHGIAAIEGGVEAGLLVLSESEECAMTVTGTTTLIIDDGDIHVNSDHDNAICMTGTSQMHAENINVVGGISMIGTSSYTGDVHNSVSVQSDPLAGLAEPAYDPNNDLGEIKVSSTQTADAVSGYYSGGIDANGTSTVNLSPGIYTLGGKGVELSGGSSLFAEGVVLHIVGDGSVNLSGTGTVLLTPPNPEVHTFEGAAEYEGISIFQSRENTTDAVITGTAAFHIEGLLYFPSNHLDLSGTGEAFGNQVIADTIELAGTSEITIYYLGGGAVGRWTVFLVE